MSDRVHALLVENDASGYRAALRDLAVGDLPDGEVLVRVRCSSLNYKDALAVTGAGKVVRRFPMVPGIDLAGEVVESRAPALRPGDAVFVTGQGLGETLWGGYATHARLPAETLSRIPAGLDAFDVMAIGTAGFTAMRSLMALEQVGVAPGGKPFVVTGAGGGVGSFAVLLAAQLGHAVTAVTGRDELHGWLRGLGARDFLPRAALTEAGAPLGGERWCGGIDAVGGRILANLLGQVAYGGAIACCGLAGGSDLPTTVFPFILRNVALLGIGSAQTPRGLRDRAWERLARAVPRARLPELAQRAPLARVPELAREVLAGRVRGRYVIDVA